MRKTTLSLILLLSAIASKAQIVIDYDQFTKTQNVKLKMTLFDAKSDEPLSYASVYLVPAGDTTITNFALSNEKGYVEIKDVLPKKYEVNVEMIGYLPYKKVHELKGWEMDLGAIKLEENPEYIDAASITALGNGVTMIRDTIIYNATAFHVGTNAMLEDLLKKMPGIEVDSEGKVKVNGEAVEKITVGGKTFFFNDPAIAVKNLPAKIVDKIKVMDKQTTEAKLTGMNTSADKEKVMDVELKEEYKDGWFGNVKLSGGASLVPENKRDLKGQKGVLFNGNAMLSGFNTKDQVILLGNGNNAPVPGQSRIVIYMDGVDDTDELDGKTGLQTVAMAGVNYNTSRIKGIETNANVSYNFNHKNAREKSFRTSFRADSPEIYSDTRFAGLGDDHKVSAAVELMKESEKYHYWISPLVSFTSKDRSISNTAITTSNGTELNNSTSTSVSNSRLFKAGGNFGLGFASLGKEGRSVTFSTYAEYVGKNGNSAEYSNTLFGGTSDIRNLLYDNAAGKGSGKFGISYIEPINEKWKLNTTLSANILSSKLGRDAFNGTDHSANDYYTTITNNDDYQITQRVQVHYNKGNGQTALGADLFEEQNIIYSKALGNENRVGDGEWIFNWSPFVRFDWNGETSNFTVVYSGRSTTPSGNNIIPALNLMNPVQLSVGNTYLRPAFNHEAFINLSSRSPKRSSMFRLNANVAVNTNKFVYASWFDNNGVRYAVPVNSRKLGTYDWLYMNYYTPLDKKRHFSLSLSGNFRYDMAMSYQAKTALAALNKDNFNYSELMAWLWGNEKGDKFYSGESGFAESRTLSLLSALSTSLKYRLENFSASIGGYVRNSFSKYSLNPAADMTTWRFAANADMLYTTKHGWEFGTNCNYTVFRGFSFGKVEPEFLWNASISKDIKAITLSLQIADILNQSRSLSRDVSAEYIHDTYYNVMGRYFLFGISFNFGKMNAEQNSRARDAMFNMMM